MSAIRDIRTLSGIKPGLTGPKAGAWVLLPLALGMAGVASDLGAQNFPSRPIRLID